MCLKLTKHKSVQCNNIQRMNIYLFLLSFITLILYISCKDDVDFYQPGTDIYTPISTKNGNILGKKVFSNDKSHWEFLGIPYAEPPIGNLRFKAPVPVKPLSDVFEAFNDGNVCMQPRSPFIPSEAEISEDCLTLNIFTNNINISHPIPVMVWIHGGGFIGGSKDRYRMQTLIDQDVILVTINYRLHALGFISFGNNLVSGNMGLKDQHLAIMWVKQNIHNFGGNADQITIFGESSGGQSVQAHVLSPYNSDLLYGAIAQSGSILYLSVETPGIEKKYAKNAAEALGCSDTLDQETLDCLQNVDAADFVKKVSDPDEIQFDPINEVKFSYFPIVDDYADEPFLPFDPLFALKTGTFNKIPFITGTVENEGVTVNRFHGVYGAEGMDAVEAIMVPAQSGIFISLTYGQDDVFRRVALNFYNHSSGASLFEQEKPAIDFTTDTQYLSYDQKSAELMSNHVNSVYNFYFTQKTNRSGIGQWLDLPIEYTPVHGDDEEFLVSIESFEDMVGVADDEKETAMKMVKYWTNFAKNGSPNTDEDDELLHWNKVGNEKVQLINVLLIFQHIIFRIIWN